MVVTGEGVMSPVCVCVCVCDYDVCNASRVARHFSRFERCPVHWRGCGGWFYAERAWDAPCAGPSQQMVMVVAYLGDFRNGVFEGEGRLWVSGSS